MYEENSWSFQLNIGIIIGENQEGMDSSWRTKF